MNQTHTYNGRWKLSLALLFSIYRLTLNYYNFYSAIIMHGMPIEPALIVQKVHGNVSRHSDTDPLDQKWKQDIQ